MPGGPIQTERLILAPWQEDDWPAFHAIASDPEVIRYIGDGKPWPAERARLFVQKQMAYYQERGYCLWKLAPRDGGGLIGFCGIEPLLDTGEIEIGWWLARDQWGKGLASEAARAALDDAVNRVGLSRIVAIAQPANTASVHIMRKLGMRYERPWEGRGIPVVMYVWEFTAKAG